MLLILSLGLLAGFSLGFFANLPTAVFCLMVLAFGSAVTMGAVTNGAMVAMSSGFVLSIMAGQVGYVASLAARRKAVVASEHKRPRHDD
jgi:hypothetical protein